MRRVFWAFCALLAACVVAALVLRILPILSASEPDSSSAPTATVTIGDTSIRVGVADTESERTQGLSGRRELAEGEGLLFVFPEEGTPGFWMKDMHFAIDIIWISSSGSIIGIERNIAPETFPEAFFPPSPVRLVLEVPGGFSDAHDIEIGANATFSGL